MAKNYTINQVILQQFSDDELLALLPEVIVQCVHLIGVEQVLLLVDKFGGTELYMPTLTQSYHEQRLIDTIGEASASKLVRFFAGERVYIPRCDKLLRQARNRKFVDCVAQATDNGMSQTRAIKVFAYEFGFSERYAYEVLKASQITLDKPQDNQLSLF